MTAAGARARRQLHALARAKGVEVRWRANDGTMQTCSDDTLIAVLQMLRIDIRRPDDAAAARVALRNDRAATVVDPVAVAWDDAHPTLRVRLPPSEAGEGFSVVVEPESGQACEDENRWTRAEVRVRAGAAAADVVELTVELPRSFDPGRYRVGFETATTAGTATLIVAPTRLPAVGGKRAWGVFAPVYALHARERDGTGDLGALDRLARWVGDRGGEVIGTLPMLSMFVGHGEEPCDPSPYAPVSRRYWNELFLDLGALPDLAPTGSFEEPAPGRLVDLPRLAAARRPLLEEARRHLDTRPQRRGELEQWLDAHPDARAYAAFRAALEGSGPAGNAVHEYAQWMMSTQLAALSTTLDARGQTLYVDLPVGTHRMGYDVAAHPALFLRDASVGAPPDDFQPMGQDWGFPPVDPGAARADGYAYLASCLTEQLRYARRLRLDHVMGLDRLWMIPAGASATDGAYVHYEADEQWATVVLAAFRNGGSIIGEDLGTVPRATDRAIRRHRALGMWVVQFELPEAEDVAAEPPGGGVLACLDTHDLPTFATWWHQLAPIPRGALLAALRASGDLDTEYSETISPDEVLVATLSWLGRSRAPLVLAALEDLWLEPDPQNIPGSDNQDATFRQRTAFGLDELDDVASVKTALDALDHARRTSVQTRSPA
jgi:4-alpha-glucanotransferase